MKKFFVFLLILLLILGGVGFWGYQKLTSFVHTPVNVTQDQLLTIERGTTGSKLAALLEQEKILDNADLLPWLLKLQPQLNKVKAGTYSLTGVKTLQDLLDMINSGKEAQFSVKFIEGKTFKEWRKNLESAPHLKQTLQGKVASVFINRLKANMKLQTDPTVIYGMGESYTGNIRKKDLETITPYNTYMIEGLPPTPIAMVSESALQAVAHPAKTDFYYFVADGSGGHKFTRNLNEHNKAVQEYLRWYRSQQKGAN